MFRKLFGIILFIVVIFITINCSTKSEITFNLYCRFFDLLDIELPHQQTTVILENHNGNPANVYKRTTETNSLTFIDVPFGIYTIKINQKGFKDYFFSSLVVNTSSITHVANLDLAIGNIFSLQGVSWQILEIKDNEMLLITEKVIAEKRFDLQSNIWFNSEIRQYLQHEFYDSLPDLLRLAIVEHNNDPIFLLSTDEIQWYLKHETDRVARNLEGLAAFWWLRSPGYDHRHAAGIGNDGTLYLDGYYINDHTQIGGVRPAIWIKY